MADTFRALCAELVGKIEYTWGNSIPADVWELLNCARNELALADEPAVPEEGREPATWTEGVCGDGAALLKDGVMVPIEAVVRELNEGARARAVLARWGNLKKSLTSSPPADGEVTPDSCNRGLLPMIVSATGDPDEPELERIICSSISGGADYLNGMPRELSLQRITAEGSVFARYIQGPRSPELTLNSTEQPAPPADGDVADRAAELLQRQVLVPVSVDERLPGLEDCDAEGRCWWLALHQSWPCLYLMKADIALAAAVATHWLPAHALPLPEVNNG